MYRPPSIADRIRQLACGQNALPDRLLKRAMLRQFVARVLVWIEDAYVLAESFGDAKCLGQVRIVSHHYH
jgi:hypothetical protein